MWIVKLEPGVWLADGDGDPPRTLVRDNAKRFSTYQTAWLALDEARRWRPFEKATITAV